MSSLFAYTNVLKPAKAKRIVADLECAKEWTERCGGMGGIARETNRFEDITRDQLAKVKLPDACGFLKISSFGSSYHLDESPVHFFIGGDDWQLPDIGLNKAYSLTSYSTKYDLPVSFLNTVSNTPFDLALLSENSGIAQSKLTQVGGLDFTWGKDAIRRMNTNRSLAPEDWTISDYEKESNSAKLWLQSLGIPTVRDWNQILNVNFAPTYSAQIRNIPKFLQGDTDGIYFTQYYARHLKQSSGRFWLEYDPERFTWPEANRRTMLNRMFQDALGGSEGKVQINGGADLGSMNWFHGATMNVGNEARELLQRTLDLNTYKTYDISFLELGPETWNIREKRRKAWEKTVYQELGTATLENGVRVDLRLNIEKEGYIVCLDFPDDEDMIRFQETELYKLTEWHCGAK
jgi:hypothetical protein